MPVSLRARKKKNATSRWSDKRAHRLLACVAHLKPPMKENPKESLDGLDWSKVELLFNADDPKPRFNATDMREKFHQFFKNLEKKTGLGLTHSCVQTVSRKIHAMVTILFLECPFFF